LIRAGRLLKIDVLDHVIIGRPAAGRPKDWASLRELGHCTVSSLPGTVTDAPDSDGTTGV
jgi:hypothetical protein